jgi:hypothetical protein
MKKIRLVIAVAGAMVLSALAVPASAATQDQINHAITNGLAWLVSQQNSDGSWGSSYPVAYTGFAVTKLEERAFELGYASPFDDAYPYKTNVINGLNYLFNQASTNATTGGVCFAKGSSYETYSTGIAMMAIAASRTPNNIVNVSNGLVNGMTYQAVLQLIVNYFAAGQNPDGGWRYYALSGSSDNSNTGYAVMGLRYAEAPIYGFACTIPATLKAKLSTNWINAIQVSGGTNDGGGGYTAGGGGVNLLETGNLLFEMSFVGDNTPTQRVQRAIGYIQTNWNDNNENPGWRPHQYQAMDCLMEGFGSLGIPIITVNGTNVDWFGQFSDAIVASQQGNGSWPADGNGDVTLSTDWALLVLEKIGVEALQITPATGFTASGCVGGPFTATNVGGPFTATSETFSLTNIGTAPLNWSLANSSSWLDASLSGGTLTVGGTTNATVSLNANAYSLTQGVYTATVWFTDQTSGLVQSRQFTLTVGVPVITAEPTNQMIEWGNSATFSVGATGAPLYFQWQKNGTDLTDAGNISGSATTTLVLSPTTTNDDGSYTVIITDACGSVTSSVVTLTVLPQPTMGIECDRDLGLRIFSQANALYTRTEMASQNSQMSWVNNATYPVTYSFTVTNLPPIPDALQTMFWFIPANAMPTADQVGGANGIGANDTTIDADATNAMCFELNNQQGQTNNDYHVFVGYKINTNGLSLNLGDPAVDYTNSLGNHVLFKKLATNYYAGTDPAYTMAASGNGTWTLTFSDATHGSVAGPGLSPVSFTIPAGDEQYFTNALQVYFGVQNNSFNSIGDSVLCFNISINGAYGELTNDFSFGKNWSDDWRAVENGSSRSTHLGLWQVPENIAYWLSWTAPASGYDVEVTPYLTPDPSLGHVPWVMPAYYNSFTTMLIEQLEGTKVWTYITTNNLDLMMNYYPSVKSNAFFRLHRPPKSAR